MEVCAVLIASMSNTWPTLWPPNSDVGETLGSISTVMFDVPASAPRSPFSLERRPRTGALQPIHIHLHAIEAAQEFDQHPNSLVGPRRPDEYSLQPPQRAVFEPHYVAGVESMLRQAALGVEPVHLLAKRLDHGCRDRLRHATERHQPQHAGCGVDLARRHRLEIRTHEQIARE